MFVCLYVHLEELRSITKVLVWGKRDGIPDEDIHERQCVPKNQTSKEENRDFDEFRLLNDVISFRFQRNGAASIPLYVYTLDYVRRDGQHQRQVRLM